MISFVLALAVPDAQAACTVGTTVQLPADDSRAAESPRFAWSGDCTTYQVQVSTEMVMTRDNSVASSVRGVRTWKPGPNRWSNMLDRATNDELYWRVVGWDAGGVRTATPSFRIETDWDDDADGSSFRDGDCDDADATSYPGATEVIGDGIDQDCDGQDNTCATCAEECTDDLLMADVTYSGSNIGLSDAIPQTCGGGGGPDNILEFTAPTAGRWSFRVTDADYDTTVSVSDTCAGPELSCNDDSDGTLRSNVIADLAAGDMVAVAVSGFSGATGSYDLLASLVPANETDCADGLDEDADGFEDCFDADCAGTPECTEDCTNGFDDDGDFATDCADVDCEGEPLCGAEVCDDQFDNDGDFATDCLDSDCDFDAACTEICDDLIDNDGDFAVDCEDPACAGDVACTEICDDQIDNDADFDTDCGDADCVGDPACVIAACPNMTYTPGTPVQGDTTGGTNNWSDAPCGFTSTAPDVSYEFTAPADGTYSFSTEGSAFDTILHVEDQCSLDPAAACNDDIGFGVLQSFVQVDLTMGQTVIVVVDGYDTASGAYVLTIQ